MSRTTMARCWKSRSRLAASAAILIATSQVRVALAASRAPSAEATTARALAEDLQRVLSANDWRRPFITIDQDAWGIVAGALLDLQKHGRVVSVPDDWVVMFTPVFAKTGAVLWGISVDDLEKHERFAKTRSLGFPLLAATDVLPLPECFPCDDYPATATATWRATVL